MAVLKQESATSDPTVDVCNSLLPAAVDLQICAHPKHQLDKSLKEEFIEEYLAQRFLSWHTRKTSNQQMLKPVRTSGRNVTALPLCHSEIRYWAGWGIFWPWLLCPSAFDFSPFWYLLGKTADNHSTCRVFTECIVPVCRVLPSRLAVLGCQGRAMQMEDLSQM